MDRLKESIGWNQAWMSPYLESVVDRIALNAKMANPGHDGGCSRMIAASYGNVLQLWQISDNGQSTREIGAHLGPKFTKLRKMNIRNSFAVLPYVSQ